MILATPGLRLGRRLLSVAIGVLLVGLWDALLLACMVKTQDLVRLLPEDPFIDLLTRSWERRVYPFARILHGTPMGQILPLFLWVGVVLQLQAPAARRPGGG